MFDNNSVSIGPATIVCQNCGHRERWLLYNVQHRGSFRRLCTTCVLRLHPQSFCPTCFIVYHHSSPIPNDNVKCTSCYSVSHSSCVAQNRRHPYICPMCCSSFNNAPSCFMFKNGKDLVSKESKSGADDFFTCPNDVNGMVIDANAARVLVAAATISSLSMRKAVLAANLAAEMRGKEAANAWKSAKHALEYMRTLVSNEKINEGSGIEIPMALFRENVGG